MNVHGFAASLIEGDANRKPVCHRQDFVCDLLTDCHVTHIRMHSRRRQIAFFNAPLCCCVLLLSYRRAHRANTIKYGVHTGSTLASLLQNYPVFSLDNLTLGVLWRSESESRVSVFMLRMGFSKSHIPAVRRYSIQCAHIMWYKSAINMSKLICENRIECCSPRRRQHCLPPFVFCVANFARAYFLLGCRRRSPSRVSVRRRLRVVFLGYTVLYYIECMYIYTRTA